MSAHLASTDSDGVGTLELAVSVSCKHNNQPPFLNKDSARVSLSGCTSPWFLRWGLRYH